MKHPPEMSATWPAANHAYRSAKLPCVNPISLQGQPIPERRWIVPGWIPLGQTTLLYGDGGLGKSLLAMQLATSCATSGAWLGMDVLPCKAVIFHAEDAVDEMQRRQAAINALMGIEFGDLENLQWFPREQAHENSLMQFHRFDDEPPAPTELFGQIHDAATEFGAQLVILNSLHDFFDGNENERKHARRFVGLLTSLAREIDGAVVMLAHPSLEGLRSGNGTSGNTAWNNACRSRLYLRRPKDIESDTDAEDVRVMRRMKANYARSGDELTVRWQDGAFVRDHEPTGAVKAIQDRRIERVFLECLDAATEQRRALSHSKNAPDYAPRVMAAMPLAQGLKAHDFAAAMQRLFNTNAICVGSPFIKPNRHPATGLVRAVQNHTKAES